MASFDYPKIKQLSANLAAGLLALWRDHRVAVPPAFATADRLATLLEPGVAAFLGQLLMLAPDQADDLPAIIDRYFADPAMIDALDRFAARRVESAEELAGLLFVAGLAPSLALHIYFRQALAMMFAAMTAALDRLSPDERPPFVVDGPLSLITFRYALDKALPLPDGVIAYEPIIDYFALEDMRGLGEAWRAQGLARVDLEGAIAADGLTVLFAWQPALMSGSPPPDEGTEAAMIGGDELIAELVEETTTAEPPGEATTTGPPGETMTPLRLDAALPDHVVVGRAFDLAVAIKRPEAPQLAPDDLDRRESAGFEAAWPADAAFIRLRVQISAPECLIHGGDSRDVRLPAGADGPPVYFQLTPQKAGPLSVIITVYQETDWVGSTRLRTEADNEEPRGQLAMTVTSRPLGNGEVNLVQLRQALDDGYNDSEMRDLCFELNIDYEDLPGDGQSAKARELVLYARRHGLLAQLVEKVMQDRPQLLVTSDE
ncbi:MAG TPA: hypothetical protein PLD89_13010 [Promineifilum sp.]|nr:hypothetical protein [Promineifilum sp.]HRO90034.1 hypothetical protein [Promineifilum sp.]